MRVLAGALVIAGTALTAGAEQDNLAALRPISGAWRLDAERSQDARSKMREQMERGREDGEPRGPRGGRGGSGGGIGGPGGGMGGPGGGMGGRGGGPGGSPPGARMDPRAMREAMDEILTSPEKLAITARTSDVEIVDGDGEIHRMRPDGRKMKHEGSAVTETQTRWDGDALVLESSLGPMMKVTERYSLDAARGELVVDVTVKGPRGEPTTARRVYVRDGAAAAQ